MRLEKRIARWVGHQQPPLASASSRVREGVGGRKPRSVCPSLLPDLRAHPRTDVTLSLSLSLQQTRQASGMLSRRWWCDTRGCRTQRAAWNKIPSSSPATSLSLSLSDSRRTSFPASSVLTPDARISANRETHTTVRKEVFLALCSLALPLSSCCCCLSVSRSIFAPF